VKSGWNQEGGPANHGKRDDWRAKYVDDEAGKPRQALAGKRAQQWLNKQVRSDQVTRHGQTRRLSG